LHELAVEDLQTAAFFAGDLFYDFERLDVTRATAQGLVRELSLESPGAEQLAVFSLAAVS